MRKINNSLVTIIIPVYNVEKYLDKCIQSVIGQTYRYLEIILVDDGSTDNSGNLCDLYKTKDKRIKVIHKENGGLSDARNYGLNIATGEYIIFLDSDDYIDLNMVENVIKFQKEQDSDVVIWGYSADYINKNDELIYSIEHRSVKKEFKDINTIELDNNFIGLLGYAWNKMYRTSLLKRNNFKFTKGISLVEDIIFNSSVLTSTTNISFIETSYVHYMQRNRKTLGTIFYENHFELRKQAINSVERILSFWRIEEEKIKFVANRMIFESLKETIRLLVTAENYNYKEKKSYLNIFLKDADSKNMLKSFIPSSYKDKLFIFFMKSENFLFLFLLYKLTSVLRSDSKKSNIHSI